MPEKVLETKNLSKRYGRQIAVKNLNMNIYKGDIYGFVGENGAGKSTVLRMLTGLTKPSAGEVSFFGSTKHKDRVENQKRMSALVDAPSFYPNMSAKQNLEYYRLQRGIVEKELVMESLEKVGLAAHSKKKFKHFSLGMKQRLALAYTIMERPDLIVLDEPINGLDPAGIIQIRELILELNQKHHVTFLITSHLLAELAQVATTYGFLQHGILLEEITKKELDKKLLTKIKIFVEDITAATTTLELICDASLFEVRNHQEIVVQNPHISIEEISRLFFEKRIYVQKIYEEIETLETYFNQLTEAAKGCEHL